MRTLHPFLIPWLKKYNQAVQARQQRGETWTPESLSQAQAACFEKYVTQRPHVELVLEEAMPAPNHSLTVRIYHPRPNKPLPVLVFFHGGAYVAGSAKVYDPVCRKLALTTDHLVVCPDYRRAPENPFPAAIEDAVFVVDQVLALLEGQAIKHRREVSLAGDSCGGALAALVSSRPPETKTQVIKRQVLIYPGLDYTLEGKSMQRNGTGYLVDKAMIEWCLEQYFQNGEDRKSASPLFRPLGPSMPDTLVVTAEFCPMLDDGRGYVRKLGEAGFTAREVYFDDMIHNFLALEDLVPDACRKLYESVGIFLQQ